MMGGVYEGKLTSSWLHLDALASIVHWGSIDCDGCTLACIDGDVDVHASQGAVRCS